MEAKQIITVMGSGGKTGYITALSQRLQKEGKRVLVVTTTHMWLPDAYRERMITEEEALRRMQKEGLVWFGQAEKKEGVSTGKMIFPNIHAYERLREAADAVLCEGDGSRGMPLKIPRLMTEPVLLPGTTVAVIVQGLTALGKPASQVCQRWEEYGIDPDRIVTKEWMAEILEQTYLPWLKENAPEAAVTLVWNQADTPELLAEGRWLEKHFAGQEQIKKQLVFCLASCYTRHRNGDGSGRSQSTKTG